MLRATLPARITLSLAQSADLPTARGRPVAIVSGFIDERVERAGRALGVREFVHKPGLPEMCAVIDRLCGRAHQPDQPQW